MATQAPQTAPIPFNAPIRAQTVSAAAEAGWPLQAEIESAAASNDVIRVPAQSLALLRQLLSEAAEGEPSRKLLARLEHELHAAVGMLSALLDTSRIEADSVETTIAIFPIIESAAYARADLADMSASAALTRLVPTARGNGKANPITYVVYENAEIRSTLIDLLDRRGGLFER